MALKLKGCVKIQLVKKLPFVIKYVLDQYKTKLMWMCNKRYYRKW